MLRILSSVVMVNKNGLILSALRDAQDRSGTHWLRWELGFRLQQQHALVYRTEGAEGQGRGCDLQVGIRGWQALRWWETQIYL